MLNSHQKNLPGQVTGTRGVETEREEVSAETLKKEKEGGKDGKFGLRNPFYHKKEGKQLYEGSDDGW